MKAFLEKYADSFEVKDAIKMILKKVECAKHDEEKAMHYLATDLDMIEDLVELKGHNLETIKRY